MEDDTVPAPRSVEADWRQILTALVERHKDLETQIYQRIIGALNGGNSLAQVAAASGMSTSGVRGIYLRDCEDRGVIPQGRIKGKYRARRVLPMDSNSYDENELLTAKQCAKLTTVSENTLHAWAARRESGLDAWGPPHLKVGPGSRRWLRKDVEAWLESCRVTTDSVQSKRA